MAPIGAATGVDRATLRVELALECAVLAGWAAEFIPGAVIALTKARAACTAEAGFAGEAFRIAITVAVGSDACFLCTVFLRRADVPFLAALSVAAGSDRAALATAFD